ncbi:MAG TPA: hypothetical protein VMI54_01180 [Polyangiaceae bacterium]|nr:hypothetical protein [Polyangiaceae bacterium]
MLRGGSVVLLFALLPLACGGLSRRTIDDRVSYSTNFDTDETPLSENGAWHHAGSEWTSVDTADGNAFGTQPLGAARGPDGEYNDSYAYLAGFPPDQLAEGVIHLGAMDPSCTHEVELLLRWADSSDSARGYECNLAWDGSYAEIVRWNGALGDFDFLAMGSVAEGLKDGDTFSASVVGHRIALSVNGVERASVSDATFADGNPGIGFWRGLGGCGTFGDFGFTSFTASSVGD